MLPSDSGDPQGHKTTGFDERLRLSSKGSAALGVIHPEHRNKTQRHLQRAVRE